MPKPHISPDLAATGAAIGIDLITGIIDAILRGDDWKPLVDILPEESRTKVKLALEREKTVRALEEALND